MLIEASCFTQHIRYIAGKAKSDEFCYASHCKYDQAVHKLAVKEGFGAFSTGNQALALCHYTFESLCVRK